MNLTVTVNHKQLLDVLLNIGLIRPVFIWGAPGIGKSAIVQDFADSLGLPCVSLLGSQLAPEDIIGVPQIRDGYSVFCPPRTIARQEPYVLFLDELNACTSEVQKAFYSLIHEGASGNILCRGLYRGRRRQPGPGQCHHPAHVLRFGEPDVPCGAHRQSQAVAGVGGGKRHPSLCLRLYLQSSGSSVGKTPQRVRSHSPRPAPGTC